MFRKHLNTEQIRCFIWLIAELLSNVLTIFAVDTNETAFWRQLEGSSFARKSHLFPVAVWEFSSFTPKHLRRFHERDNWHMKCKNRLHMHEISSTVSGKSEFLQRCLIYFPWLFQGEEL